MTRVEITVDHKSLYGSMHAICDRLRAKVTREIARDAVRFAPRDTNELADSITAHPAEGIVRAGAGHAAAQEMGASPHPIPNAFGSGQTVQHPGNVEQPYLRPALYQNRRL